MILDRTTVWITMHHMLNQLMGNDFCLIPDQVIKANPETYISYDDPPFFIEQDCKYNYSLPAVC